MTVHSEVTVPISEDQQHHNPTEALLIALRDFRSAHDPRSVLPELERLARAADALDEVAEAVEDESEHVENPASLVALLSFCGRLREDLNQPQKAITQWNDVLAAQPTNAEALEALTRLLAANGDLAHAAEASLRRARLSSSPSDPSRQARFVTTADLFIEAGDSHAALNALDESLAGGAKATAQVQLRRARLLESTSPANAATAYAEALFELEAEATEGLLRLLVEPSARRTAAQALEPVVRRRGDRPLLTEVLQARVEHTSDATPLLLELAALHDAAGEARQALATCIRAGALGPLDSNARALLERLAVGLEAKDELLATYEEWLERDSTPDPSLILRVAQLHEELGDAEKAFEAWEWAAEAAPGELAVLAAFAERCREQGDFTRLAKALRWQLAATTHVADRVALLGALGRLCEEKLGDPSGAAQAYRALIEASPGDRPALESLKRLAEERGDAIGVAGVLERQLALGPSTPHERVELLLKLARLMLVQPGELPRALELLREVLSVQPGNAEAVEALTTLASVPGQVQREAAQLVTPGLMALGDFQKVVQIFEAQLAGQSTPEERVATLREISKLQAGPLNDPELAFLSLSRALRELPSDDSLLQQTTALAEAAGAEEELELLLGELAAAQPSGHLRLALTRTLARRLDARTESGERGEAITAWTQVLEAAPGDAEAQGRLEALLAQAGRLSELAKTWQVRVDAATPIERPAHMLRLAEAQENAGQLDEAATTLMGLFTIAPTFGTLVPLERVLAKLGRDLERAESLARLAAFAGDANDAPLQARYLVKQAQALISGGHPERALRIYGELATFTGSERATVEGLLTLAAVPAVRDQAVELMATLFTAPTQLVERKTLLSSLVALPGLERAAPLRAELAELDERLGHLPEAFEGRLRLFQDEPRSVTARAELERLAVAARLETELVSAYQSMLRTASPLDRALEVELKTTIARLGSASSPEAAIALWEELERSDRTALEPLQALEVLYRQRADWSRLAGVLERRATLSPSVECWSQLARVATEHLHDATLAARAWEAVLEQAPHDPTALAALSDLHKTDGRHQALARVLEQRVELEPSVTGQVELLFELANLFERELHDADSALTACRAMLDRSSDPRAFSMVERLCEQSGRIDEWRAFVARQLAEALAAADAERMSALRVRLARIDHRFRADDQSALELLETVRATEPQHPEAIATLEALMRSERPASAQAAHALESHAQRTGNHALQIEALEVRALAAQPVTRAQLLHQVADLHERTSASLPRAFDAVARLLRADPSDIRALERVVALAGPAKKYAEASALLAEVAPSVAPSERVTVWRELAAVRATLGDVEGELEALHGLLEVAPTDLAALERRSALLEKRGEWPEFEAVLSRRLALTERGTDPHVTLIRQLSRLQRDGLLEPGRAAQTLRELLALRPDDADALEQMDALCVRLSRWPELVDVLERRIRLEQGDRPALLVRLAKLQRERAKAPDAALALLGELLHVDPKHAEALRELESLIGEAPGWAPAAQLALTAYRRNRDYKQLAVHLDARANVAQPGAPRAALWLELAEVQFVHQGDPELAFLAIARAWRDAPTDLAIREKVETLAEAASAHEAMAALFEEVLPLLSAPHDTAVTLSLARLYEKQLTDPARAATLYRAALKQAPHAKEQALAGLDRTLLVLKRWEELLLVLEAREALLSEGAERLALLLRIGAIANERVDQPHRAVEAYRAVLTREPLHPVATQALEGLYERTGEVDAWLELLERRLPTQTAGEQRALRLKMARLCQTTDVERCIALCRHLLNDDPLMVEAFTLLCECFEATSRWAELEALLDARLRLTREPAASAELSFKLAQLIYRRRKAPSDAIERYRAVLEHDAHHFGSLDALREIFEASGDQSSLAKILSQLGQGDETPARRREYQVRLAEVRAVLGERDGAITAARAALGLGHEDLETELKRLRSVLVGLDAVSEVATTLERLARLEVERDDTPQAIETLLELAVFDTRQTNTEGAAAALEQVLLLDPKHRVAYERAGRLYTEAGLWAPWATMIARFLPNLTADERRTMVDRLSAVNIEHLGDSAAGLRWAIEAVRLTPGSAPRRRSAEALAGSLKKLNPLADAYAQILSELAFGRDFAELSLALAAIQDLSLDRVDAAEQTLCGVLAHDPAHDGALTALVQLFARRGLHERHAKALEQKLEFAADRAARVEILAQLAVLEETKLAHPSKAVAALGRLMEVDPSVAHARLVVDLHRRLKTWPEALKALQALKALCAPGPARVPVQLEIARLQELELQDPLSAVTSYLGVLELARDSSEAFRALERLYVQLERPLDLLRTYEQRLALSLEPAEAIELHFKSADLWEKREQPLNADNALKAVLKIDPTQLRALERLNGLRRAGRRWRPLLETLEQTVNLLTDPTAAAELCTEAGQVHLEQLRDPTGAHTWWTRAVSLVTDHRPALEALVELHVSSRQWPEALALLKRQALLEEDAGTRARLEHRAGTVLETELHDAAGARAAYQRSLQAHPVYLPALRRLRALLFQAQEWSEYEATLAQEAKRAPSQTDRCAAAIELAAHFEGQAQNPEQAVVWYEHALKARAESLEAALPLCDVLVKLERWPRAAEVLTASLVLLEREPKRPHAERVKRLCHLAAVYQRLSKPRLALETYDRAGTEDPGALPVLSAVLEVLGAQGQLGEARLRLEAFLQTFGGTLPTSERATLLLRLATVQWGLRDAAAVQAAAESVLELEKQNVAALELLVVVGDAQGQFEKSAIARKRLAAAATGDARVKWLVELGEMLREKIGSPLRAVDPLLEALKLKPASIAVLEQLYASYRGLNDPRKAAQTLQSLVNHPERSSSQRGDDSLALAELLGRHLEQPDRAATVLEQALDENPSFVPALQALETVLANGRAWARLASAYARIIERMGSTESAPVRAAIWRALGELRLRQLGDKAGALEAFEASAKLLPFDGPTQETFADLALGFPDRARAALEALLRVLPSSTSAAHVCLAARLAAEHEGDLDSAWSAARAAEVLNVLDAGHRAVLTRSSVKLPPTLTKAVSTKLWRERLLHPQARGPIAEVMTLLCEAWAPQNAPSVSDFQIHPKHHAIDRRGGLHAALTELLRAAHWLALAPPAIFSPYLATQTSNQRTPHPDDSIFLKVLPTSPPSVVVGQGLLEAKDRTALHALFGAHLCALRPEVALTFMMPPDQLEALFEAALGVCDPSRVSSVSPSLLKIERKRLDKALTATTREALKTCGAAYLKAAAPGDFKRFCEGASMTTLRVALLISGDLAAVRARLLPAGPSAEPALRELLRFALGGDLRALRVATGHALVSATESAQK